MFYGVSADGTTPYWFGPGENRDTNSGFPDLSDSNILGDFNNARLETGYMNDVAQQVARDPFSPESMVALQPIASYGFSEQGPWSAQQPYLQNLFSEASRLYGLQFDPTIAQSQEMRLQNANASIPLINWLTGQSVGNYNQAGNYLNATAPALSMLLDPNMMLNPDNNPYLQAYGEAATRPLYQRLMEQLLPAASSGAFDAGQYGGSREGVERGLAMGRTQQASGDTLANIYSNAYGQGLQAMQGGINSAQGISGQWAGLAQAAPGLGSQLLNLWDMPAQAYNSVGRERFTLPWENLGMYQKAVGGNYGKSGKEVKTDPGYKVGESMLNTFGNVFGGMLGGQMMCWVAEELYGPEAEKTHTIRHYVMRHVEDESELGEFCREYRENGRAWAQLVRDDHDARTMARELWDRLYEDALQEGDNLQILH